MKKLFPLHLFDSILPSWDIFARIKNNWLTYNKHLPALLAEIIVPPAQHFHRIKIFHPGCRRDFTEVMQCCWQLSCLPWGYDWKGRKGENNWEKKTCLLSHCVIICECGVVRKPQRTWEMERKTSDHRVMLRKKDHCPALWDAISNYFNYNKVAAVLPSPIYISNFSSRNDCNN